MKIRIADRKDYPGIINIYNQAVDEKYVTADTEHITLQSRAVWFNHHDDPKFPIFITEENNEITGWCSLSPYREGRKALNSVAELSYYINKNHRRKGTATLLINHTLKKAKELGYKNLISILLDINKPSINLLEKAGFEKWGHLPQVAEFQDITCGQIIYGRKI
ncbi:MAG: GNAT family N-acetyltransferase [Ignavibacteriaceae bacterium]